VNTYYLTTPIYYANDVPHIGHAYTTIAADAVGRYHRLRGEDVFVLTGTDEHGINIERIAASRGLTPQQHVDEIASAFRDLWTRLDIRYDRFVRTTEPAHRRAALALWQRLVDAGDVYRDVYSGAYCSRCEAYYQADELNGESDCPIHGLPCEQVREKNWFFRLSRFSEPLERLVRDTDFVQPASRRNEILGVLSQGLRDFSVSRRQVRWGIPVPDAPDEVLYVWVDALANYLTGVGYPHDLATFERFWPADVHIVGKEIIRFHCLYWPALLLSAGLPLPRHVFAHGWLTRDGHKISKTTGNVIDPAALATEFGSDAVRYFFLRAIPFGQDGDYTRQQFVDRYNADLANDFGNLVQRATTLAQRFAQPSPSDGPPTPPNRPQAVPSDPEAERCPASDPEAEQYAVGEPDAELCPVGEPEWELCAVGEPEAELCAAAVALGKSVAVAFDTLALHAAVAALGAFVNQANRYIELTAPWRLAKQGETARLEVVLQHVVEAARLAAWYSAPIIPRAAAEAHQRLAGSPPSPGGGRFVPRPGTGGNVLPGLIDLTRVEVGPPLFPRRVPDGIKA
jgi:methionyl-tRNA synthetase